MKLLHTSDWHLGRSLYGRKRYDEFGEFLNWLSQTIITEKIDVLLVAGDIFDTSTPSNKAQELYYQFLCKIANSCCRHVVIIGGNHDSPTFLNAPKDLLRVLNVHVVGAMTEQPEDEVITLCNKDDHPEVIICAVPYLRDKDIRNVEAGESIEDKNNKLIHGLKDHYAQVCQIAQTQRDDLSKTKPIPIIAMGHLFTAGGKTLDGDGVRELYVGSLAHVDESIFPKSIDYVALGHLHVPQCVGKKNHIRYSGSPIPMGFGEARQEKKVIIVDFEDTLNKDNIQINEMSIPCFQALEKIAGSQDKIYARLAQLKQADSSAWLEIEYTGKEVISNFRETLDELLLDTDIEIRRIKNKRMTDSVINAIYPDETLDDLDVNDVFQRCLERFDVPEEERDIITQAYLEIIKSLNEDDVNAE
ncbi:exonuclease SbcCD subunit D C-terminal domain-containing protein [sulfur-oxidizing endosymbiont of Gigantopelta aegis]|uniref:exonuclease SbcCD subunit D C-terminal domain-containing protein n=1 Tax=sulfur-oxidizing endosymbiont of Gigantopelta aegis TaxID=2794934 RepID=UPI0018DB193D|nr:exonuclease SbcCD subunit D C-terminal domain-containing protein [sulfur-oxidizing endosymbiont of Gigantopelta aegis]